MAKTGRTTAMFLCLAGLLTLLVFQLRNLKINEVIQSTRTSAMMDRVKQYEITTVNVDRLESHQVIEFKAFNETFVLDLAPSVQFLPETLKVTHRKDGVAKTKDISVESCYYQGSARTFAHSKVTLSVCEGQGVRGEIHIVDESYIISPAAYYLDIEKDANVPHEATDPHIVYRSSDVAMAEGEGACGTGKGHKHDHVAKTVGKVVSKSKPRAMGAAKVTKKRRLANTEYPISVKTYVVLDPSRVAFFRKQYGANWEQHARASTIRVIHHASQEYVTQDWGSPTYVSAVSVVVAHIEYWHDWTQVSIKGDNIEPFTVNSKMGWGDLLGQFGSWFQQEVDQKKYDNAVLLSMLDFNKKWGYVGLAGIGSMHTSYSASASINTGMAFNRPYSDPHFALIVAHEMGHNFGCVIHLQSLFL